MRIKTTVILMIVIVAAFAGLIWRCVQIQIQKSKWYSENTQLQQNLKIVEPCRRGMILDRGGNQLAISNIIYNVFADPAVIKDHKTAATALAEIIDQPAHIISQKITKSDSPRYTIIEPDITLKQKEQIDKLNLYGIGIESQWKRYNPNGRSTCHITGFVGVDNTGLAGIEFKYENLLKGQPGYYTFTADSARRPIRLASEVHYKAQNGSSLILTIDSAIQNFVHDALAEQYKKYQAQSAMAIVIRPDTGEVLAMVSLPDFEPSEFFKASPEHLKNCAITDTYEPGSIFKPIVATLALDENVITRDTQIFCEQGRYSGKGFGTIGEYGNHSYGNLTVKGILINSSNIGMAKIGQKMGKQKLYDGLRLFGFGRKTGIDLPGEDAGILWPVSGWTGYSVTRIPYGQEVLVTALQIARAYCILANGGKTVRPYLVKAIVSDNGKRIELPNTAGPPGGHIVSSDNANWIVRQALSKVVNEGTGKRAALEKWQVFGKTGTANIALPGGKGYDERNYIASFVGGAPAEDPEIVVLVSIKKPNRSLGLGYTGGTVAAPVVKQIIEKTLTYLKVPPEKKTN